MDNTGDIGIVVGIVLAVSLALQTALGPAMNSMVEALKAANVAKDGQGGVASLILGTGIGSLAGLLAVIQGEAHNPVWIGVGALAGLVGLGAGGVRSHLVSKGLEVSGSNNQPNKPAAESGTDAGGGGDSGAAVAKVTGDAGANGAVHALQELALGRTPDPVPNGR